METMLQQQGEELAKSEEQQLIQLILKTESHEVGLEWRKAESAEDGGAVRGGAVRVFKYFEQHLAMRYAWRDASLRLKL